MANNPVINQIKLGNTTYDINATNIQAEVKDGSETLTLGTTSGATSDIANTVVGINSTISGITTSLSNLNTTVSTLSFTVSNNYGMIFSTSRNITIDFNKFSDCYMQFYLTGTYYTQDYRNSLTEIDSDTFNDFFGDICSTVQTVEGANPSFYYLIAPSLIILRDEYHPIVLKATAVYTDLRGTAFTGIFNAGDRVHAIEYKLESLGVKVYIIGVTPSDYPTKADECYIYMEPISGLFNHYLSGSPASTTLCLQTHSSRNFKLNIASSDDEFKQVLKSLFFGIDYSVDNPYRMYFNTVRISYQELVNSTFNKFILAQNWYIFTGNYKAEIAYNITDDKFVVAKLDGQFGDDELSTVITEVQHEIILPVLSNTSGLNVLSQSTTTK